jgi:hypothetical protein
VRPAPPNISQENYDISLLRSTPSRAVGSLGDRDNVYFLDVSERTIGTQRAFAVSTSRGLEGIGAGSGGECGNRAND